MMRFNPSRYVENAPSSALGVKCSVYGNVALARPKSDAAMLRRMAVASRARGVNDDSISDLLREPEINQTSKRRAA